MKSAAYGLVVPTTIDEAIAALVEHGPDARLLAGGQSLMPLMAARVVRPSVVIDLGRVPGLTEIVHRDNHVAIGAMTTQRAVERSATVVQHVPLLALAVTRIAHATIRNRGTIGGSLAHADPTAEIPVTAVALEAVLVVVGPRGRREVAAAEFFVGPNRTLLEPGDVLVEVRFPTAGEMDRVAFEELSRRPGDVAAASAAVQLRLDADGRIARARVALGSVAPTPVRAHAAEAVLIGRLPSDELFAEAATAATAGLQPSSDLHATGAYRRHVAGVLVRRALASATGRPR
ncbi:MAG: molybdopterin dehydrogenase FAD-binding protein [Ilumatobacteraceae bacterium]|nr:molybdopterin dehydrogenase FAD-binding protein [Ilumatobacteraceae bacterium]